ncbi:MAG: TraB/GumN family protein [Trueperaceae bacterium]|jgi:pheromone shutdown-related protein TraB|nr:TraB/GumN family protein [Truepera sp.]HRQ09862.1 TraB/GumN family protein [Trueperaceae bacterium]
MRDESSAADDAPETTSSAGGDGADERAGEVPGGTPGATAGAGPATEPPTEAELRALAGDQPLDFVTQGGVRYTLLGTAHVSKSSAAAVTDMIEGGRFDAVAIELDAGRYRALTDPDAYSKMDLFKVLREGKAAMLAVNLALSAFQQRMAEQFGVEPGAEMKAAIKAAGQRNLPVLLVDRDIGVTLRRVYANVPWWQRITLFGGLLASAFSTEKISEEDIEALKEGDILESTFTEFAAKSEKIYRPLIAERDEYMVSKLLQQGPGHKDVLVVMGAGHLKGVAAGLREPEAGAADASARLEAVPPPSKVAKALPWVIVAIIVAGFVVGFSRSADVGLTLLTDWTLIHLVLSAVGATIALAHPLTILVAAAASPFTALNPLIGVGFVAAGTELWLRRPNVGDFEALRHDVTKVSGWWRNRAARVLLVFILTTLGSASGTYIAGFRIFHRLFGTG